MPNTKTKQPDLSVVVPCYNEEANITALHDRLQKIFKNKDISGEIVFVNDASSDNTGVLIDDLSKQNTNITPVHHEKNQGIEGGWKSGVEAANGIYVCLIDADLQYLPEEVWRLYREMLTHRYDIVQGVRSSIGRLRDNRYLLSKALNLALNLSFGMRARDNKSGFVIAPKETLEDILSHRYSYYYFQTFITVSAHAKGYSVGEVETLFQSRYAGQSFIKGFPLVLILKVIIDLIKGFIEFRLRQKRLHNVGREIERQWQKNPKEEKLIIHRGWRWFLFQFMFLTMRIHTWMLRRRTRDYYNMLQRSQWLEPEQIKEIQELRLRKLVRHVYFHTPYYREMFLEKNLTPSDINTLEDLDKLPLLTKQDVRDNLYFDLFADNHKKPDMLKISTSGSTGEPFVVYADRDQLEMRWATTMRSLEWTGWRLGDRQARLWHQTIGMSWSQALREKINAFLMRRMFIPAFQLKEDNFKDLVSKLKTYKPKLLDGYAECFNFLSHFSKHNKLPTFSVPAIMTSAQTLSDDVRKTVEEAFQTKIYDKYGSREFSGIAYECGEEPGYHVMAESYIVEILKDGKPAKPGEIGEVVITDLNNFFVPLIRYRIGDLAEAVDNSKACSCGRGLPKIGKIQGRVQSVIICKNGTWIPGTFFSHFFKEYDYAVRQYQIVQHTEDEIEIKIVRESIYDSIIENEIKENMQEYLGKDMHINITETDELPLGRTGKHLSVISELKIDFQAL